MTAQTFIIKPNSKRGGREYLPTQELNTLFATMVLLELSHIKNSPLDRINESSTPRHILATVKKSLSSWKAQPSMLNLAKNPLQHPENLSGNAGNFFNFLIWNNNILK
jgi:hypothetical protein